MSMYHKTCNGSLQPYLVKRPGEVSIKEISVNDSFTNNASHESEVSLVIWIDT